MAVDKMDKLSAAAVRIQATFRGNAVRGPRGASNKEEGFNSGTKEGMAAHADKQAAVVTKSDRQLSRVEFINALVKAAIEKYVKTKQNPNNELEDVSNAVDKLFCECIEPALRQPLGAVGQPLSGTRKMPRIPRPDEFREAICYKEGMGVMLWRSAPPLRIIFAGLARLTYEISRQSAAPLPKIGHTQVMRPAMDCTWVALSGLVSIAVWRAFISGLGIKGAELREVTLCFIYSIMAVVDGSYKERHLPFEGVLEALVRFATCIPIPTDQELEASEFTHAGPFMDKLEAGDASTFQQYADAQTCEWGDIPDERVAGDMVRRVSHLIDIILRRIKQPKEEGADMPLGPLTRREFRLWAVRNMRLGNADKYLPDSWAKETEAGEC